MLKFLLMFMFFMPAFSMAQSNPFSLIKYDRVVAYEFEGMGGRMITNYLGVDTSSITASVTLTDHQVKSFERIITSPTSYGNTTAACFDPHLAVVYYQGKQVVATVDVCLGCNYLVSSKKIPATSHNMVKVSDDHAYPAHGFSKEARQSIHEFCSSLGFVKYLEPLESVFDE